MGRTKPWKINQKIYQTNVRVHKDARDETSITPSPITIKDIVSYVTTKQPCKYPLKSYMVAIIYATLIEEHFGDDFYSTLNDPDLFLGEDSFYRTYDEDALTYDLIITTLKNIPNWISGGWASETTEYWRLECTPDGIRSILKHQT